MAYKKCPYCAEEILEEAIKCKHCRSWLDQPPLLARRLTRSATDCMIAGVCGGIGKYLGVDSTLVRVAYAVITVCTALFPGILIYVLLMLIIPKEGSAQEF